MAKITTAEVNKLRKQTGAGMLDCNKGSQSASEKLHALQNTSLLNTAF